jgi:hypothetical protein
MLAVDLIAWTQHLLLSGDLVKAEPKALRYRLLHIPARLTRGGRRRHLRIPESWPWAVAVQHTFTRVMAIPAPG